MQRYSFDPRALALFLIVALVTAGGCNQGTESNGTSSGGEAVTPSSNTDVAATPDAEEALAKDPNVEKFLVKITGMT